MNAELAAALLIGLLGSSHCLVMCGGIAGALQLSMSGSARHKVVLQLLLSAGRLSSYALFGAAVGYFGASAMQLAGASLLWLRLLAGVLLLMMALYISRLWFGLLVLEKLGQHIWRRVQPVAQGLLPLNSAAKAYAYGLCWGALPCGLVYSTLGWSLASGSAGMGALLMLSFGVGTLPAILLTGSAATLLLKLKNHAVFRYSAALLLAIYAIYTIWLAIRRLVF
ncbi:MAG: sulfite exporter TauE/SafE family protein [Gammaproteobacteria bacterium]|nr:sulfite exporter TauE/SafE family protein [Gammaproteobacteria bacterium]MBU2072519.1 sulfite exporter TauE/SafE family protein [Gammaproteobacteria bacterium]MBU2181931.1 sulfite exporter TauE/SafE family protein [Gammaproteobacteria bacterium]MBU2204237.1 sulfite exporter TauE/SafE family protein [Gammaproteobacteria bacterium]